MRILIVSQYFWPESFRINELAASLAARGAEIVVLTGKPNYPKGVIHPEYKALGCQKESYYGVEILRVPIIPRGSSTFTLALNYISFVMSGLLLGPWLLRHRKVDVILVFGTSPILQAIPAILLGKLKGCPLVLWIQDLWPESLSATGYIKNKTLLRSISSVVKWIYTRADLLLVQSRSFIPKVSTLAGSTPIVYYPNSFIKHNEDATKSKLRIPDFNCEFSILFAGNLGAAQALNVITEAAELLRDHHGIKFIIVGDGSRRDWLVREIADRKLVNIMLLGQHPVEAMPAIMSKADVLLVTLADSEILGLTVPSKIQAYLAAGRPIIASLNGAGAEIIAEAKAGIAVPAEDSLALSQAIHQLRDMTSNERNSLGQNGEKFYIANFSHTKLVDELMTTLADIVGRGSEGNS